jgi:hypothetical protein
MDNIESTGVARQPDMAVFDYRPEHLLRLTDKEAAIPELKMAQQAASQCSYVNDMDKGSCQISFPLFEKAISGTPSSKSQLDAMWQERGVTEQRWNKDQPISDEEDNQYMQSYDRIKGAADYRFVYGTTLNNYGFKYGDEATKEKAKMVLADAAALSSPENYVVKGALIQANRGEKIDYSQSYSEGAVQAAVQALSLIRDTKNEKPALYSMVTNLFSPLLPHGRDPSQRQIQTNLASEAMNHAITEAPASTALIVAREISELSPDQGQLLQSVYKAELETNERMIKSWGGGSSHS